MTSHLFWDPALCPRTCFQIGPALVLGAANPQEFLEPHPLPCREALKPVSIV